MGRAGLFLEANPGSHAGGLPRDVGRPPRAGTTHRGSHACGVRLGRRKPRACLFSRLVSKFRPASYTGTDRGGRRPCRGDSPGPSSFPDPGWNGQTQMRRCCGTGDGAAGFYFLEMQSAARKGLNVTVVVFAEGSWTMEESNERMLLERPSERIWARSVGTGWPRDSDATGGCRPHRESGGLDPAGPEETWIAGRLHENGPGGKSCRAS